MKFIASLSSNNIFNLGCQKMKKHIYTKVVEIIVVIISFLLFWLLYYLMLGKIWPNDNVGKYRVFQHLTQCATFCVSAFLIFPRYAINKQRLHFILLSLFSILVFTELFNLSRLFLSNPIFLLLGPSVKKEANNIQLQNYYFQNFISALTYYLLGLGYAFARDWINKDRKSLKLEKEIAQAELTLLRNQLNPHFLFNTINNIYYLSLIKSTKTADALLQLSDLLRYVLSEKENLVTLDKEYECLEKFIQLHKLRFPNDNIILEIGGKEEFANIQIPPMLLITFVENAFKHGDAGEIESPIEIKLAIHENQLTYSVKNKIGKNISKNDSSGIGIPNLIKRLTLLYPKKHKLENNLTDSSYFAKLEINLNN
ncbi:MAG TPA: sensor histidine kinase [Sediminibacterium sp.]|uniref:sensor histidine kinase n=1 Tax=Sediminibacterium sp. TaxID=1917865 RepID=UPI002B4ACF21|nr:sensor histidine kinase [Sediminibacterium sp.]HLD52099.1 sensor histidine kinase [Sediminibacterium sp.]